MHYRDWISRKDIENRIRCDDMVDIDKWKGQLALLQIKKDEFFKSGHPQSPIPAAELSKFNGLNYYPPDPAYRFELVLHEHSKKETIKVEATKGEERVFIRWGEFKFKVRGEDCKLQAYKSDPMEERLFVPFRDATSGKETYGAGRYIDLEPDRHRTAEGKWILDLNVAYNTWCAYSEDYTCPLVPPENWLKVPVLAGEKNYTGKKRE